MKEKNKDILQQALAKLPSYEPSPGTWEDLALQLDRVQESVLLEQLPSYSPPSSVWNQINKGLETSAPLSRSASLRAERSTSWRLWATRVAAAVLLFSAGYLFATWQSQPKVSFAIRQEQGSSQGAVLADWNDEEASFQRVMAQLAKIDEPKLNALRTELEELTRAKKEVEQMLKEYGQDNRVIRQLAEIETQRSQVYRLVINEL